MELVLKDSFGSVICIPFKLQDLDVAGLQTRFL